MGSGLGDGVMGTDVGVTITVNETGFGEGVGEGDAVGTGVNVGKGVGPRTVCSAEHAHIKTQTATVISSSTIVLKNLHFIQYK